MSESSLNLGLTDVSAPGSAGGCGCGCGGHDASESGVASTAGEPGQAPAQSFAVTGLTCGHCASSVTEELSSLAGVQSVEVDLVAGGTSTVRVVADRALTQVEVSEALDEAGSYSLV